MNTLTPIQEICLFMAEAFHWAFMIHFVLMFTGKEERHKQIERVLPSLVKMRKLVCTRYGKKYIYALPHFLTFVPSSEAYYPHNPYHGLMCTEALVRFVRADTECEIYPEKFFKSNRFGVVPEWGVKYNRGSVLLFEFCTASNFFLRGNVQGKITRYEKNTEKFTEKMGHEPLVVFVLDIPKLEVVEFVSRYSPDRQFFFVDAQTFKSVPMGEQLTAPIYLWGDVKEYPLRWK